VEFVVKETPLTANEVGMKIIGLETIHNGSALPDGPILKLQKRHRGGVVFIGRKDVALGLRTHARDALDFTAHAQQQSIECVAPGGEQGAATFFFSSIPTELAVPWSNAMVVINFRVVEFAQ
jgi:hypothetical protein